MALRASCLEPRVCVNPIWNCPLTCCFWATDRLNSGLSSQGMGGVDPDSPFLTNPGIGAARVVWSTRRVPACEGDTQSVGLSCVPVTLRVIARVGDLDMLASWMEWRRQRAGSSWCGWDSVRVLSLLVPCFVCMFASEVRAQCGFGGDYSGECVRLELRISTPMVLVGSIIEVELHAQSVNSLGQPIQAIDTVFAWDELRLRLVGKSETCLASDLADPCYMCPSDILSGIPVTYNWASSGFPKDEQLDGINADCGPETFCPSYTGLPFNDGGAFYQAIKQVFCNGMQAPPPEAPPAPDSLLVTAFKFEAIAPGTAQIELRPVTECQDREMVCIRGDIASIGDPCLTDSDCGERICFGGSSNGLPCASNLQCPLGLCLELCTACSAAFCCTGGDNCADCAFARTRVIGGISVGLDVTDGLGPPVTVTVSDCQAPTAWADGSRYINIIPAAGVNPVALLVTGESANVSCVSMYVGSDGVVRSTPIYKTPAEWASALTYAFNDPSDPTVHARGIEISSAETYSVRADCGPASPGTNLSDPVEATLWLYGDTDNNLDRSITDTVRILDGFQGVFHTIACTSDADCSSVEPYRTCDLDVGKCVWIHRENVDILGIEFCGADRDISIRDALHALSAFQGLSDFCSYVCP